MGATDAKIILSAEDRTAAAFKSAQGNLQSLQSSAAGIITRFGGVAAAITAAFSAINGIKGVIDLADDLGKLSQRTGIAIGDLSALRYSAELAGVSFEELQVDLKKFSINIASAAAGGKEQLAVFKALGISQKFLRDNIGDTQKILVAFAEAQSRYGDGANKVALFNAAGGKSFEKLIPLFNEGAGGFKKGREELEKLGAVFTPEFRKKSEEFNDNLRKIGFAGEGLKISLGGPLLDVLVKLSGEFLAADTAGKKFGLLLDKLKGFSLTPGAALFGELSDRLGFKQGDTDQVLVDIKRTREAIASLEADLARNPSNTRAQENIERLRTDLAGLEQQAKATANAPLVGKRRPANEGGGKFTLPPAPELGAADKAAAEALAALKKITEGRIEAIQASLAQERDAYAFQDGFLKQLYDHADISLQTFYQAQDETRRTALQATRDRIAEQIAVSEQELNSPLLRGKERESDRNEIRNKIAKARAALAKAEQDADQAATTSVLERLKTSEALRDSVKSLQAQIADLSGDKTAEPLLEIAVKVREARRLLVQDLPCGADTSGIEAQVNQYERLLKTQLALSQARENFRNITDRLQITEERIALQVQTGALNEYQALQAQGEARRAVVAQLEAQLAAQQALAAGSNDPTLLNNIERTRLELDKLKVSLDPLKDKFDNLFKDAGANFFNDITSGKGLKSALRSFGNTVFGQINSDISRQLSAQVFDKGGIFGEAGGLLANIFRPNNPATTVPGFAGGAIDLTRVGADGAAQAAATAAITAAQASSAAAIVAGDASSTAAATTAMVTAISASTTAIVTAIASGAAAGAVGSGAGIFGLGAFTYSSASPIPNFGAGGLIPGFALGGRPPVGAPYWVGENGPELRIDDRPGVILNNADSKATAMRSQDGANRAGRAPAVITQHFHITSPMTRETQEQLFVKVARAAQSGASRGSAG